VTVAQILAAIVAFLACASVGGGLYEALVLDPVWPNRPAIIQPRNGGVSRRRFWIPVHTAFEVTLLVAIVACWGHHGMRTALLIALASHLVIRKAVAFEKGDPATIERAIAQRWTRRSLLRLPLDVITCMAALAALALA
jgi:2-methylcitrate dehydratase PrpD